AREVERALAAAVEIECRKGLRFGVDDGVAPACRNMNAARHAGASLGGLRAFGRDDDLGGIVGVEDPDRAIVEREQQALAFVIGVDLADNTAIAARARPHNGTDWRDAALTLLSACDVSENDLPAVGHADQKALLCSGESCILGRRDEPLVLDLVDAGAAQGGLGVAGLEQAEKARFRQAEERKHGGAIEAAFVEFVGSRSRERARARRLRLPE